PEPRTPHPEPRIPDESPTPPDQRLGDTDRGLYALLGAGVGDRRPAGALRGDAGGLGPPLAIARGWAAGGRCRRLGQPVRGGVGVGGSGAGEDCPEGGRANAILTASIAPPSIRAASREMGEQLLSLASTWSWSREGISRFEASAPHGREWRRWNHAAVFGML